MDENLHRGKGTASDLLAFQRLAWSTIVFSLTRRCPLSCPHCITSSGPWLRDPIVSPERAARWAAELPQLAAEGLKHITFTGGEPVLALEAIRIMAEAAQKVAIKTAVVTSGAWATTSRAAKRVTQTLANVSHWDLGYDEYHEESLPWERFVRTVGALSEAKANFSVRVCEGNTKEATEKIVDRIRGLVGKDVLIITQPVRKLGRASDFVQLSRNGSTFPQQPCMSTGPFVREDGSVAPCCSGLAYNARGHHPFEFGNADEEGLGTIWRRWRADQLLRLMRLVGLALPVQWLVDDELIGKGFRLSDDVCETCVSLWSNTDPTGQSLRQHVASAGFKAKLDDLERHLFGSVWDERPKVCD
jgi:pyruvate-formate lyase-activating enzyme